MKRGFGESYLGLLEEWIPPMSKDAMLMFEHWINHKEKYGGMRHTKNQPVETSSDPGEASIEPDETTKIVMDPKQSRHMVCKLLERQMSFLQDLLTVAERNTLGGRPDAAPSSDFNPRFLADANRELRRALEWYRSLEEQGL
ncbi:MAG: hypothetical protein WA424_12225 [Candidatus Sulfotelmatobacter sp.]